MKEIDMTTETTRTLYELTPITNQGPCDDWSCEVEFYNHATGFFCCTGASFKVESVRYIGEDDRTEVEHTAHVICAPVGEALLGRKDLVTIFGAKAVEAVEAEVSEQLQEDGYEPA